MLAICTFFPTQKNLTDTLEGECFLVQSIVLLDLDLPRMLQCNWMAGQIVTVVAHTWLCAPLPETSAPQS